MKKRILKVVIVMTLLALVYSTIVNALSFTVTMTPSSTTVPESTEFSVVVKVSNIDINNENGINQLSGYLKYDEDVFETINESRIDGSNGWNATYEPDNEGKISLTKTTFVETEENVFQITFKTKEGTNGKTGKIQFTKIMASNSETETSASDISITIEVGNSGSANSQNGSVNGSATIQKLNSSSNTNTNTNVNSNTNTNKNTNTNTNANTNVNTNTNRNTNVNSSNRIQNDSTNSSDDNIPYTGVEDTVMYIIGVIVVVAIIFYIKFEKINKEMK